MGYDTSRRTGTSNRAASDTPATDATAFRKLARRLLNAIKAEEAFIDLHGGTELPVRDVVAVPNGDGEHLYDVTLARARTHLRTNSSLRVVDGTRTHEGRVIFVHEALLRIALTQPLSSPFSNVRLRTDSSWLLRAVRHRLSATFLPSERDAAVSFRGDLMPTLLRAMRSERAEAVPPIAAGLRRLNTGQRMAFQNGLRAAVHFIHGPPGTGKTTVLATITEALVRAERTVLYVVMSNAAADIAAEKIAQLLARHPDFDRGLVLRYGRGAGNHLLGTWGTRVIPDRVFERLAAEAFLPLADDQDAHCARTGRLENALAAAASHSDALLRETGRRLLRRMRLQIAGAITKNDVGFATCRVVITTAHNLALSIPAAKRYDTVIIDEASQMPLPLVLLAASHADNGIIVGGDPQQLPPIVESRKPWVRRLLGTDIFRFAGVTQTRDLAACTMLVEQYRMSPPICALVSELAYGGRLRPHESVRARRESGFRHHCGALSYIDTSACGSVVTKSLHGSRENLTHVRIATWALYEMRKRSLIFPSQTVAVVSPFAAQAAQLHKSIGTTADVSTVHAYQGAEVDFLILDLTDAHGAAVSRFLQADSADKEGGRLLTVALSRAREGIIMIADFRFLEMNGGAYVRRLLAHMQQFGSPLPFDIDKSVAWFNSQNRKVG